MPDGQTVTERASMMTELHNHWPPMAQPVEMSGVAAERLRAWYHRLVGGALDWTSVRPPSAVSFKRILQSWTDTASGPDGVPYSGYAADADRSSWIFESAADAIMARGIPPDGFNYSRTHFAVKGSEPTDHIACHRAAGSARPLVLKNCDLKVIACGAAVVSSPVAQRGVAAIQRGFVADRQ